MSTRRRNGKVDAALDLLRQNPGMSIAAAARETGAPRKTVSDNWHAINAPVVEGRDDLSRDPATRESEIPVFHLDYSDFESLNMYPMGDTHVGAAEHAAGTYAEWIKYLVDTPNASMLHTGDAINAAVIGAVSDTYAEKLTVDEATDIVRESVRPLADDGRLDGIARGNHEQRVWDRVGVDVLRNVARELSVPYTPASALFVYHVGDVEYKLFLRHGTGNGAATLGSQANQLEKAEKIIDADIYVSGHTHTQLGFPVDRFYLPNLPWHPDERDWMPDNTRVYQLRDERIARRKLLFVSSGSFLGYETYAAQKGFRPAHIGAPRIFMDGRRKDAHASV